MAWGTRPSSAGAQLFRRLVGSQEEREASSHVPSALPQGGLAALLFTMAEVSMLCMSKDYVLMENSVKCSLLIFM